MKRCTKFKDTSLKMAGDLVNVLFHEANEEYHGKRSQSFKTFQNLAREALVQHKYRLARANQEFAEAIHHHKKSIKHLSMVVCALMENGFHLISAEFKETRFSILAEKGKYAFPGFLWVDKDSATLNLYADIKKVRTEVLKIKYSRATGLEVENKVLQGLLKTIE